MLLSRLHHHRLEPLHRRHSVVPVLLQVQVHLTRGNTHVHTQPVPSEHTVCCVLMDVSSSHTIFAHSVDSSSIILALAFGLAVSEV